MINRQLATLLLSQKSHNDRDKFFKILKHSINIIQVNIIIMYQLHSMV